MHCDRYLHPSALQYTLVCSLHGNTTAFIARSAISLLLRVFPRTLGICMLPGKTVLSAMLILKKKKKKKAHSHSIWLLQLSVCCLFTINRFFVDARPPISKQRKAGCIYHYVPCLICPHQNAVRCIRTSKIGWGSCRTL